MSIAGYEAYRTVDLGWVKRVPSHWDISPLKRVVRASSVKRTVLPSDRYLGLENISSWTGELVGEHEHANADGMGTEFRAGDVLFGKLRPYLAKVALAAFDGIASTEFLVLCGNQIEPRFLRYSMSSRPFIDAVNATTYGVKMPRANWEDVGSQPQPLPPLPEQRAIADFLDRETAKIDALIAKQEELIERIEEHGSAVVNHALTCGLNDSAPMKSARVDGNPQVPAHWPVLPLKYWVTFLNNRRIPLSGEERAYMVNKTYDYYGASGKIDLVEGFIFEEKTILIAEDGANLYSRSTPLAFIAEGKYWVNNHAHILRPKDGLFDLWVEILNRIDYTPYITGSAQPKLTIERLANIPFAAPEGEEAAALERFVRAESERTRPLMKQVREMMARLIERRSSLITAAVTGQIEIAAKITAEAAARPSVITKTPSRPPSSTACFRRAVIGRATPPTLPRLSVSHPH